MEGEKGGCDDHPENADKKCRHCMLVQKLRSRLVEQDRMLRDNEIALRDNEIALREQMTFEQLAKTPIVIDNETMSSAHTHTRHVKANYTHMLGLPTVTLGDDFWKCAVPCFHTKEVNSEADVNNRISQLLSRILVALGLHEHLTLISEVSIMDTIPDHSLVTTANKKLIGTVEGKKPEKNEAEHKRIFGSGTAVAGEVFEQITLSAIASNNGIAVGLLSTLRDFQLIANQDVSSLRLDPDDAVAYFKGLAKSRDLDVTPDKAPAIKAPAIGSDNRSLLKPVKKAKTAVEKVAAPAKKKKGPKMGSVYRHVKEHSMERKYYASKAVAFGSTEAQNREVFEALAAFVLLCVAALKEDGKPQNLKQKKCTLLTRRIEVGIDPKKGSLGFKQIKLPLGMQFQTVPGLDEKVYYAIRQLGYGLSGASCLACTAESSPCVLKFYLDNDDRGRGKPECELWHTMYNCDPYGIKFARFITNPRKILVMPYLRIPHNQEEREYFVRGDKSSLLYEALTHVSNKGYIHKEAYWHHVGLWTKLEVESKRRKRKQQPSVKEIAVFCDLDHLELVDDDAQRHKWVEDTFEAMKGRLGKLRNDRKPAAKQNPGTPNA